MNKKEHAAILEQYQNTISEMEMDFKEIAEAIDYARKNIPASLTAQVLTLAHIKCIKRAEQQTKHFSKQLKLIKDEQK